MCDKRYISGENGILLRGYSYSIDEINEACESDQILCLRLETNYKCNLDCLYCYSYLRQQEEQMREMKIEDAYDVIDQAVALGLKSIVYLGGGEPFLYSHFWELIEYMYKKDVIPVIFTNGMLITEEVADRLYDLNVSIMIKMDGYGNTQEYLTGHGTYNRIHNGLNILMKKGFNKLEGRYTRLGIAPCVNKVNLKEIPEIWKFARENHIFPNLEKATRIGRATSNITIDKYESQWLTEEVRKIDASCGIEWISPYSSITGHSCGIFKSGLAVTVERGVSLCPEMDPVDSLVEKKMEDIIKGPVFQKARHLEQHIDEPCKSCEHLKVCFGGCRSKALNFHDSIMACDPFCPIVSEKEAEAVEETPVIEELSCSSEKSVIVIEKESLCDTIEDRQGGEDFPLSMISITVNCSEGAGENIVTVADNEVRKILYIHCRECDALYQIKNTKQYHIVCPNCEKDTIDKVSERLDALLNHLEDKIQVTVETRTFINKDEIRCYDEK